MEETMGVIRERTFSFEWIIENFSSLPNKNGDKYQTPSFECFNADWSFSLYPSGYDKTAIGWISVFLKKQNPKYPKHVVDFKISAKCGDAIMRILKGSKAEFSEDKIMGRTKFLKRTEVLEKLRTPSQKVLTISCVITWKTSVADAEPQGITLENVSTVWKTNASLQTLLVRNRKELYISQSKYCDLTISAQGQVLPAQKGILVARSSVFAAMFAHDTVENRSGTMKIDDFEPDTVKDFLMYMYTGNVDNMSCENVFDLYAISDKYDVQDLKEECIAFMKCILSLETVCEVLLLAETYTEMELFEFAKNFVSDRAEELLSSEHWGQFASENILLAYKTLKMIVLDDD